MFAPYECPDCHRTHDEPAEAALGLSVRCLDCYFDAAQAIPHNADFVPRAA